MEKERQSFRSKLESRHKKANLAEEFALDEEYPMDSLYYADSAFDEDDANTSVEFAEDFDYLAKAEQEDNVCFSGSDEDK